MDCHDGYGRREEWMDPWIGYILVAGGLGYIGSSVVLKLVQSGYNVVIADNLANSKNETFEQIKEVLALENTEFTENQLLFRLTDLTEISAVEKIFKDFTITGVIALAGLKAVGESLEIPTRYYQTNLNIITNLLEVMQRYSCFKLIFSSSSTVYGEAEPPFDETQPIGKGISNPYGFTKYLIEEILIDLVKFQPQWSITSLRYFNPVGCHHSGLLADNPRQPLNLVPIVLRSIISGEPFKVFGDDYPTRDGTAERDYIHVLDLADAHICALQKTSEGYHIYNVGLEKPVSVYEIIEAFERVNNVKLNYQIAPKRDGDLAATYAKCDKAKSELGWSAKLNLDHIVRDCYAARKYY